MKFSLSIGLQVVDEHCKSACMMIVGTEMRRQSGAEMRAGSADILVKADSARDALLRHSIDLPLIASLSGQSSRALGEFKNISSG